MQKRRLPLNALRAFAAVYETGGIRSAAQVLGVAHSSISRHIRFLEETLGVPLLDRDHDRRELCLTLQGKRLGVATAEALTLLSNAVTEIRETHARNSIVISTTHSASRLAG